MAQLNPGTAQLPKCFEHQSTVTKRCYLQRKGEIMSHQPKQTEAYATILKTNNKNPGITQVNSF